MFSITASTMGAGAFGVPHSSWRCGGWSFGEGMSWCFFVVFFYVFFFFLKKGKGGYLPGDLVRYFWEGGLLLSDVFLENLKDCLLSIAFWRREKEIILSTTNSVQVVVSIQCKCLSSVQAFGTSGIGFMKVAQNWGVMMCLYLELIIDCFFLKRALTREWLAVVVFSSTPCWWWALHCLSSQSLLWC